MMAELLAVYGFVNSLIIALSLDSSKYTFFSGFLDLAAGTAVGFGCLASGMFIFQPSCPLFENQMPLALGSLSNPLNSSPVCENGYNGCTAQRGCTSAIARNANSKTGCPTWAHWPLMWTNRRKDASGVFWSALVCCVVFCSVVNCCGVLWGPSDCRRLWRMVRRGVAL